MPDMAHHECCNSFQASVACPCRIGITDQGNKLSLLTYSVKPLDGWVNYKCGLLVPFIDKDEKRLIWHLSFRVGQSGLLLKICKFLGTGNLRKHLLWL